MKRYLLLATVLLAGANMLAQEAPAPKEQTSGTKQSMKKGSMQKSQTMHKQMQDMQAEMQQMRTNIDKLRADAEKVSDANTKAALLDNADMWEQFFNHMQEHMQSMKEMHEHGMMQGGMMHEKKAPSEKPSTAPPPQ